MIIHPAELSTAGSLVRASVRFEHGGQEHALWYELGREWGEAVTVDRADAFVVALLPLAMEIGEDMDVRSPMSERLHYHLQNHYVPLLLSNFPRMRRVRISPQSLSSNSRGGTGFATGFSGGIDSFCLLREHLGSAQVAPSYRLTHLLFHNSGSHNEGDQAKFRERYERLAPLAREWALPFIAVNSNLHHLLPSTHLETHTPRSVSFALLLQGLLKGFAYASGFHYSGCHGGATHSVASSDPMGVPLLSTEGLECWSSGCQYSRVEKTRLVSEFEPSYRYLHVCIDAKTRGNCSVCSKCARTLLTLEILGKAHLYKNVFCLDAYGRVKARWVARFMHEPTPEIRAVLEAAREMGHKFPLRAYAIRFLLALGGLRAYRFLKRKVPKPRQSPDTPSPATR